MPETKKKTLLSSLNTYSTIGFSIFDFTHIFFGIYFFERAFRQQGSDFVFDVAESSTEIVCSILLLLFIIEISKKNTQMEERHRYYTFAWLISSVSVFLPEIFRIPNLIINNASFLLKSLSTSEVVLSGIAFILFIVALFIHHEDKKWIWIIISGIIFSLAVVPVSLTSTILQAGVKDGWWLASNIMINIAPLFPVGFAFYSLTRLIIAKKKANLLD
jgi:hypothetical protein